MSTQIQKKQFNESSVLNEMRKESGKGKEFENIIELYERGMTYYNNQYKKFLSYGNNEIIYQKEEDKNDSFDSQSLSQEGSFNRSSSINNSNNNNNDQQDQQAVCERAKSLSQNLKKEQQILQQNQNYHMIQNLKQKLRQCEESNNILREQNERLSQQFETINDEAVKLKEQLKILMEQNSKQIQNISQKDDQLAKQQSELKKLKEVELRHVETIQQIKDQLEKKIDQITVVEADRNQLIERYLLEKQQFAEKMNQLNNMQDELNQKMNKMSEDEEYLMKRKLNFQTEVQKSGVKMPTLAPTLDEAKITLQTSEVPQKPSKILLKQHRNEIYCIGQSLNGSIIASCAGDNTIKLFDPLTMNQQGTIQTAREDILYMNLCFAPYSELLLAGLSDKTVQLFNYTTCKSRATFQGHNERVNAVSFTSEKEKIASGSSDRSLKIWDVNKVTQIRSIMCGSIMKCMDYFQSEPHVITGHNDGSVRLYSTRDTTNTKPIYNIPGVFENSITCVKLSNCQNYILVSSTEGFSVKVIDLRKSSVVKSFEHAEYFNNHEFNKCCFGPDDKYVIAGCADSSVFIWNFHNGTKKSILRNPNHQGVVVAVDYHNVSGNLYSGDSRGNILIWN